MKPNGHDQVAPQHASAGAWIAPKDSQSAFGQRRKSLNYRFVYAVISQRANGLSIGVNLNPDQRCNFDCTYCEVNRDRPGKERRVETRVMGAELEEVLGLACSGKLRDLPAFSGLPPELLQLKEVALSGDGEPTLCPNFEEILHEVLRVRTSGNFPRFKLVLITNSTGLDLPEVQCGLKLLGQGDEIWAKLDAGTQGYMDRVNGPGNALWRILSNILSVARYRPVVIQSLFAQIDSQQPTVEEIEQYAQRLKELKAAGAQIAKVQVYSAHRPPHRSNCQHLPLKSLSYIARRVREVTGLKAEVF